MSFYAREKNCPRCKKHIDCKANYSGKCIALNDTNFGERDCPFYKSRIEYAKELPSAEKTAEWIKQKSGDELFPEEIVCSKCYHSNSHLDFDEHNNPIGKLFLKSKYCPNCGAKMKKSGEE